MPLSWSNLWETVPPLNLWNFPSWEVLTNLEQRMKTVDLTDEELQAFKNIYEEQCLYEYLSYSESGKLQTDSYSSLFSKLGSDLKEGESKCR